MLKLCPKIRAKVLVEPEFGYVGQITFRNGKRTFFRNRNSSINSHGAVEIARDKGYTSFFLRHMGYNAPEEQTFFSSTWCKNLSSRRNVNAAGTFASRLGYPVIVKPNHEGTSKGIGERSVVKTQEELLETVQALWKKFQSPVLCEEYIEGREFTIGVLGNSTLKILGPMEIAFSEVSGKYPVYSFEHKQANPVDNKFFHLDCPVTLGRELDRRILAFTRRTFRSLGCRDVARIDFRMDAKGNLFFLEINPLPGLAPGFSDLVVMAEKCQMSYESLIKRILTPAIQRWRSSSG